MEIKKFSIYAGLRELIPSSNLPSATIFLKLKSLLSLDFTGRKEILNGVFSESKNQR